MFTRQIKKIDIREERKIDREQRIHAHTQKREREKHIHNNSERKKERKKERETKIIKNEKITNV